MKFLFFLFGAMLFPLCGCFFEPYRPTAEFDVVIGDAPAEPARLYALEFRNDSSSGSRLLTRYADGRVTADPYNRWVLPPGQLLSRALNSLFLADGIAAGNHVSGTLEVFEIDDARRNFRLAGFFAFGDARELQRRFDIAVPVAGNDAASVAAAAGNAVRQLAEAIGNAAAGRTNAQ